MRAHIPIPPLPSRVQGPISELEAEQGERGEPFGDDGPELPLEAAVFGQGDLEAERLEQARVRVRLAGEHRMESVQTEPEDHISSVRKRRGRDVEVGGGRGTGAGRMRGGEGRTRSSVNTSRELHLI